MPYKPKTICLHQGCNAMAEKFGRCLIHYRERKRNVVRSNDYQAMYNHPAWKKGRAIFLYNNLFCNECMKHGIDRTATEVHHVQPHNGNYDLFFDMDNNCEALCKSCHSSKTAREVFNKVGRGCNNE